MFFALLLQAAACPATPAPLPPELADWAPSSPAMVLASNQVKVPLGHGVTVALSPSAGVTLAAPVGRPPTPDTASGVFVFSAPAAGRYRIALGNGAWIDVVPDGKALPSVAHAHGPACSPVRKMVDYDLAAGDYRLQIVGSPDPSLTLMIVRVQ